MKKNKKLIVLSIIFTVIVAFTYVVGIFNNPNFNIHDFCANLSSEFIGWILAVTIFQYYFDEKMAARRASHPKNAPTAGQESLADEIVKLKSLLDCGALTQAEFENAKSRLFSA